MSNKSHCNTAYPARVASNGCGTCYMATQDLPIGAVVERFDGPHVCFADVPQHEIAHACNIGNDIWILPNTNARNINHSCDPNCTINDALEVVTIKPVKCGEELSFDYVAVSPEEWEKSPQDFFWDERWSFDCQCQTKNCRGRIDRYFLKLYK